MSNKHQPRLTVQNFLSSWLARLMNGKKTTNFEASGHSCLTTLTGRRESRSQSLGMLNENARHCKVDFAQMSFSFPTSYGMVLYPGGICICQLSFMFNASSASEVPWIRAILAVGHRLGRNELSLGSTERKGA